MSDKKTSLDTGTGGFNVDGKVNTFDTGLSQENVTEINKLVWSAGNISRDNSKKDLSKSTLKTLAQFLSDMTLGKKEVTSVPNDFPIESDNQTQVSITDKDGYPARITQDSNKYHKSPSSYKNANDITPDVTFKKGKSKESGQNGNTLLTWDQDVPQPIKQYVDVVISNNRFSSDNRFSDAPYENRTRSELGVYDAGITDVDQEKLNQTGHLMTLRASMTNGAMGKDIDPSGVGLELSALFPTPVQLCVSKVRVELLGSQDAVSSIKDNPSHSSQTSVSSTSWGTLNNPQFQFTGTTSVGMTALTVVLVAAIEVAVQSFAALLSAVSPNSNKTYNRNPGGRYTLGSYRGRRDNTAATFTSSLMNLDVLSAIGIAPTTVPFSTALAKGTRAFFGLDDGDIKDVLGSPGFNVVTARAILRSAEQLVNDVGSISGNPIDVASQILTLIDKFRSSKVVSACNIFAQLGDTLLIRPEPAKEDYRPISNSRVNGSLKKAFASNNTPTVLMLPDSILMAKIIADDDGAADLGLSLRQDTLSRTELRNNATSRLDKETVELFEKRLDAEYVPFYFHDLRTNEIVSFHAFLESLGDSYSPSYEESAGIGRVESVKMYKGTSRKLQLSFRIAATSLTDFDDMWLKINKLTTLLYPQYTSGKLITDGGNNALRQPFTQLIGASPLIRLRVGDVIRSNYSKFALGRLFGLGDPDIKLNGKSVDAVNTLRSQINSVNAAINLAYTPGGSNNITFNVMNGSYPIVDQNSLVSLLNNNSRLFEHNGDSTIEVKIVGVTGAEDSASVYGEVLVTTDTSVSSETKEDARNKYGDAKRQQANVIGGVYLIPKSALSMSYETFRTLVRKNLIPGVDDFKKEYSDFMSVDSDKGNAVVKSFATVEGKGLAGFIDSMSFDFIEGLWETNLDRTAPKMVKVNFDFSPVHDISPGLDSFGFNRAPIYPVGYMSNRKKMKS